MRIVHVVGVRPNFIKIAPLMEAFRRYTDVEQLLIHTGQHFDAAMSQVFFDELGIPTPLVNLHVGSSQDEAQPWEMVVQLDKVLDELSPECVVVVGDVSSTLAGALAAIKKGIPCVHVEAGLRSFDRSMPEEFNRVVTDRLADVLLTPSQDADDNLLAEGLSPDRIHRVGNVMVDTLLQHVDEARRRPILTAHGLATGRYAVATLHRPSNVDRPDVLRGLCDALDWIQTRLPVIFPLHPRTLGRLRSFSLLEELRKMEKLQLTEPMSYLDFLGLIASAKLVLTDSGGLQEETTMLGIPCLTLRTCTERPVTVTVGTNTVVGANPDAIETAVYKVLEGRGKSGGIPSLWDGKASERAAGVILEQLGSGVRQRD